MWAAHELGHAFNLALHPNTTDNLNYGQGIIDLALEGIFAVTDDTGIPKRIAGNTTQSYANDDYYTRTSFGYQDGINHRDGGPYQQNDTAAVSEDFADMFMNWTFNSFAGNDAGAARYNFMNSHMSAWTSLAVTNNQ